MHSPVRKWPRHALRFLGVASIILAGCGLWYNLIGLGASFGADANTPYFWHAYYTMTAICMACYLSLLFIAIQFIRLKTSWFKAFVCVVVFEVAYFFGIGIISMSVFWSSPDLVLSVAAAFGVANGGLMFQFGTLFPIWGPLWGRWATTAIDAPPPTDDSVYPEAQIARPSDWAWALVNFAVMFVLISTLLVYAAARLFPQNALAFFMPWLALPLSAVNALLSVKQRRLHRKRTVEILWRRREARGLCPRCEYNLTGNSPGVCPECGKVVTTGSASAGRPEERCPG